MRRGLVVVAFVAACGGATQTTVPVQGTDEDLGLLAGRWEGSYQGTESGRQGRVTFDLTLGHHAADGQVIMFTGTEPSAEARQPLQIRFVQVRKGEVNGKIRPYTDPSCNCEVETEFVGQLAGDTLDGTFTTKATAEGTVQHGRWEAVRKR